MASLVQGTIKEAQDGRVVFVPYDTNYELHLNLANGPELAAGQRVQGEIVAQARKVLTISAGGSFIQPLFGGPNTIQGRVQAVEGDSILVRAGTLVRIQLPTVPGSRDLMRGQIVPGVMINATIEAGSSLHLVA